jgi:hypothetical protein
MAIAASVDLSSFPPRSFRRLLLESFTMALYLTSDMCFIRESRKKNKMMMSLNYSGCKSASHCDVRVFLLLPKIRQKKAEVLHSGVAEAKRHISNKKRVGTLNVQRQTISDCCTAYRTVSAKCSTTTADKHVSTR